MGAPRPDPDFGRLRTVLMREGEPDRVPLFELLADAEIMEAVLGEPLVPPGLDGAEADEARWRNEIRFWYETGYDFAPCTLSVLSREARQTATDTAALPHVERGWVNQETGVLRTCEDIEQHPWPSPHDAPFARAEFFAGNLPDGMKLIVRESGFLENTMWLTGYEQFCYALVEDPDFLHLLFEKVGTLFLQIMERGVQLPNVGAILLGEDMGFKTQTMIAPKHLQEYVFPWHKRYVELAHESGLPCILHSCGNLEAIMDDIIDDVGFDAKHSFEDVIMPVAEAKRRYGDRIAILGGVDVDFLARRSEAEVRGHVRNVLRECAPGGGYALGTGNSVANYIPVENYLAMLDEGRRHGGYPIRL